MTSISNKNKFYVCKITNGQYEYVYDCKNISDQEIYNILKLLTAKYIEKIDERTRHKG